MKEKKIDLKFSEISNIQNNKDIMYNKITINKDGTGKIQVFEMGHEIYSPEYETITPGNDEKNLENIERSIRRTKNTIRDYVYNNNFDYFITFTFSRNEEGNHTYKGKDYNIKDTAQVYEFIKNFVKKIKLYIKRNKLTHNFQYLFTLELHKSGHIHIHGFLKDIPPNYLKDSGKKSKGKPIYNVSGWPHGFSTAIKIYTDDEDSKLKTSLYVTKYVTKELEELYEKGARRYFCSKDLVKSEQIRNVTAEFVESVEFLDFYENNFYKDNEGYTEYYFKIKQ